MQREDVVNSKNIVNLFTSNRQGGTAGGGSKVVHGTEFVVTRIKPFRWGEQESVRADVGAWVVGFRVESGLHF